MHILHDLILRKRPVESKNLIESTGEPPVAVAVLAEHETGIYTPFVHRTCHPRPHTVKIIVHSVGACHNGDMYPFTQIVLCHAEIGPLVPAPALLIPVTAQIAVLKMNTGSYRRARAAEEYQRLGPAQHRRAVNAHPSHQCHSIAIVQTREISTVTYGDATVDKCYRISYFTG